MTKRYWSLIESPFQKFAAWVDEEGRLLRFNLRRSQTYLQARLSRYVPEHRVKQYGHSK